jgi:Cof subfamily protein (haloacid dehalogenase superfamily)
MDIPRYRLIAIDLDGTLLSPAGEVTPRTRAAVHAVLEAGLLVCFATGRNWTESRLILDALAHYPCAVFAGGAMVIDTHQQIILHQTRMAPELARQLCGVLEALGHGVLALQDTGAAGVDYLAGEHLNPQTVRWMETTQSAIRTMPRLSDYHHEQTIRVGIVAEPAEAYRVKALLDERFGGRILGQVLQVPGTKHAVLEIFDPAVNKWQGILHIAKRHEVTPDQIVAIGDDVNDLPMIAQAGLGVAMGNARPEVLAVAKRVIGSNKEDGLAIFLEELITAHTVEPMGD